MAFTTQYIGSRYVPLFADPAEWNSTRTYEPLTIVLHGGNSYTSKQFVPAGIDITNENFWTKTGNYNAQVEQYRQEVKSFDDRINANTESINANTESINANTESINANTESINANTESINANTESINANTESIKNEISRAIIHEDEIENWPVSQMKFIAHRGFSSYNPLIYARDNSIIAYLAALNSGFDGIECDIREDKNGTYVMLHDEDVSSVSNSSGLISELDYSTVMYNGRNTNIATATTLTTLTNVLDLMVAKKAYASFEIKNVQSPTNLFNFIKNRVPLSYFNLNYPDEYTSSVYDELFTLTDCNISIPVFTDLETALPVIKLKCDRNNKPYDTVIIRTANPKWISLIKEYGFKAAININLDSTYTQDMNYPFNLIDFVITDTTFTGLNTKINNNQDGILVHSFTNYVMQNFTSLSEITDLIKRQNNLVIGFMPATKGNLFLSLIGLNSITTFTDIVSLQINNNATNLYGTIQDGKVKVDFKFNLNTSKVSYILNQFTQV